MLTMDEIKGIYEPQLWLEDGEVAKENLSHLGVLPAWVHKEVLLNIDSKKKGGRLYVGGRGVTTMPDVSRFGIKSESYEAFYVPHDGSIYIPDVTKRDLSRFRIFKQLAGAHECGHAVYDSLDMDSSQSFASVVERLVDLFEGARRSLERQEDHSGVEDLEQVELYYGGRISEAFSDGLVEFYAPNRLKNTQWMGPKTLKECKKARSLMHDYFSNHEAEWSHPEGKEHD